MANNADTKVRERNKRYNKYVKAVTPSSAFIKSLFNAFWVGGLTCTIGQLFGDIYRLIFPDLGEKFIVNLSSITLITIAILFTGLGFYDAIGRKGGAGSFLPITGFANAMASAPMEFKTEGLILGTSVKLFSVVGPVIVNGVVWSSVVALIYYFAMGVIG